MTFRQVKLAVADDPNLYLVIRYPHDQATTQRLPDLLALPADTRPRQSMQTAPEG